MDKTPDRNPNLSQLSQMEASNEKVLLMHEIFKKIQEFAITHRYELNDVHQNQGPEYFKETIKQILGKQALHYDMELKMLVSDKLRIPLTLIDSSCQGILAEVRRQDHRISQMFNAVILDCNNAVAQKQSNQNQEITKIPTYLEGERNNSDSYVRGYSSDSEDAVKLDQSEKVMNLHERLFDIDRPPLIDEIGEDSYQQMMERIELVIQHKQEEIKNQQTKKPSKVRSQSQIRNAKPISSSRYLQEPIPHRKSTSNSNLKRDHPRQSASKADGNKNIADQTQSQQKMEDYDESASND